MGRIHDDIDQLAARRGFFTLEACRPRLLGGIRTGPDPSAREG